MQISWLQAILLGLCACLSSMPGMGGSSIGNYTLGRPLVGGLVCGLILGDIRTGILVGCAMQVVYIALVTPGGTVSADVRAVSYIGIPLAMAALSSYGLDAASADGAALATSFGTMVGTLGTVLFYGTATVNLVWQHMGWNSIIYCAAIVGIDPQLYEAAAVDGAGRLRQVFSITLPQIAPTIAVVLIISLGSVMAVGFEKVLLMYTPSNAPVSDILDTYVYRMGIGNSSYSYASAVGLFSGVIGFILVSTTNFLSKKISGNSLY